MAKLYGQIEKHLLQENCIIAGVDEVGRGALAGPVYAGAAILDFHKLFALKKSERDFICDSKKLNHSQREKSLQVIDRVSITHATGFADTSEIESIGIVQATFLAMHRALEKLTASFDILLIDGKFPLPNFPFKQQTVIGGDASCYSIAAASILAKETRDRIMHEHANQFPIYGFDKHVGYATRKHLDAIREQGICALHRKNFEPIKSMINI